MFSNNTSHECNRQQTHKHCHYLAAPPLPPPSDHKEASQTLRGESMSMPNPSRIPHTVFRLSKIWERKRSTQHRQKLPFSTAMGISPHGSILGPCPLQDYDLSFPNFSRHLAQPRTNMFLTANKHAKIFLAICCVIYMNGDYPKFYRLFFLTKSAFLWGKL